MRGHMMQMFILFSAVAYTYQFREKMWISLKQQQQQQKQLEMRGVSNSPPIINFANSTEVMSLEDARGYDLNDHLMTQIDHDPHDLKMTSTDLQADIYHYCLPYRK